MDEDNDVSDDFMGKLEVPIEDIVDLDKEYSPVKLRNSGSLSLASQNLTSILFRSMLTPSKCAHT